MKDTDYFDAFVHLGRSKAQMGRVLTNLATELRCGNFTWNKFDYKVEVRSVYDNGLLSVRNHLEHIDTEQVIIWLYYLRVFLSKDLETYLGVMEKCGVQGQDILRAKHEFPKIKQSNLALLSGVSETNTQKSLQALEIIHLIRRTESLAPAPRFAELTSEGEMVVKDAIAHAVVHASNAVSLFELSAAISPVDEDDITAEAARLTSKPEPSK